MGDDTTQLVSALYEMYSLACDWIEYVDEDTQKNLDRVKALLESHGVSVCT